MTYLFVGSHPDFLASGRPITFGDTVDASELDKVGDAHLAPLLVTQPAKPAQVDPVPPAPAPEATPAAPAAQPETTTTEAK